MYPDWPQSDADLVPLPRCDGPKLKPFDFQGAQRIEFLEYVGEGLHAHVFKVRIRGQIYALKLFRFTYDDNWVCLPVDSDTEDRALMSALYDYSEPFSCECRAFGRLQEAGHEELAVCCFGYILLDEDHERTLHDDFPDVDFTGDIDRTREPYLRTRFLGRDDRAPPIRGIVKEFRPHQGEEDELGPAVAKKMLGDISRLQQLGIIRIDVAARQLVGGQICDFSTAITVPHFITSPELNPELTQRMRSAMELETFRLSLGDYLAFDNMVLEWNQEFSNDNKAAIAVQAFRGGRGFPALRSYNLRNAAARDRVLTYVDPRRYNWKWQPRGVRRCRRRLRSKPPGWVYYCGDDAHLARSLRDPWEYGPSLQWDYRNGSIFPRR